MPATQEAHWEFTVREWSTPYFHKLIELIPSVKVAYDIGANVGGFSVVLQRRFNDIKIYSFEPDKENCDYLKQKSPDTILIEKGIYYGKKTAKAQLNNDNIGGYFLEGIHEYGGDVGKIFELTTLEELGIDAPDLIKMDVEGSEKNIIENSSIVKDCPHLIIEWHFPNEDPIAFFEKHLPKHKIVENLENLQFLLCLKSL